MGWDGIHESSKNVVQMWLYILVDLIPDRVYREKGESQY